MKVLYVEDNDDNVYMRTGDPSLGNFADAVVKMKFGDVTDHQDEL